MTSEYGSLPSIVHIERESTVTFRWRRDLEAHNVVQVDSVFCSIFFFFFNNDFFFPRFFSPIFVLNSLKNFVFCRSCFLNQLEKYTIPFSFFFIFKDFIFIISHSIFKVDSMGNICPNGINSGAPCVNPSSYSVTFSSCGTFYFVSDSYSRDLMCSVVVRDNCEKISTPIISPSRMICFYRKSSPFFVLCIIGSCLSV